ncbi:NAD(P)/FAD-dependent oxidoreductase [Streptomyces sp. NPDC050504]|uniref:NAD(P)/FAD-dependent oxidoreductase n=1 Tax=Streptomyces sp. NPDC050504 TaxID=3365618 RepID=UPI003792A04B
MTQGKRHAIVMGGSLAGLLTAHVLAAHADRVTVIERDRYPEGPEPRAGVPHGRHTHILLESGLRALDELLPGFARELVDGGAHRVGMPDDVVLWQSGGWQRRTEGTAHLVSASRPFTEWLVRRRVLAHERIEVRQSTDAIGLVGDASRVRGVRVRTRDTRAAGAAGTADAEVLTADLVVEATGRGSRAPQWLAELGAEPPAEETVDSGLGYATRIFRAPPPDHPGTYSGVYVVPDPGRPRGAVVLPLEGDRWIVTLSGFRDGAPPTDEEGFARFADLLPHPVVHDWAAKGEPASPVHGYRRTANVRRRYDRSGRRPAGFLVVGDALSAVNPVHGQGMTVAALGALALRDVLADRGRAPTTRRAQRALFTATRQAWDVATGADKAMPGTTGNASGARAADVPVDWYLGRILARASGNPVVGAAIRDVLFLKAPLVSLFAPRVLREVLLSPVPPLVTELPRFPERH